MARLRSRLLRLAGLPGSTDSLIIPRRSDPDSWSCKWADRSQPSRPPCLLTPPISRRRSVVSEATIHNYRGAGPASGAGVASGLTVLALGPGAASGLTVSDLAAGSTAAGLTVFEFETGPTSGPMVLAWVPTPTFEPACPMLGPTFLALGRGLALGSGPTFGAILALGPMFPIERAPPRCAKHMPVSKPSSMPPRITFFINCPPLISVSTCGQSRGKYRFVSAATITLKILGTCD